MNSHRIGKILLAAAIVAASSLVAKAQLAITEIYSAGSGNGTYAADWFELTNFGPASVDITGWKMDDSSNAFATAFAFRGVTSIAPGQSVIFIESNSAGGDAAINTSFNNVWIGTPTSSLVIGNYGATGSGIGLSTGGDAVNIFNSGGTFITGVTFGAATTGRTFDNFAAASSVSLLSTVGINGAFTSFNVAEIGSPGFAPIPEPSTYAFIAGLAAFGTVALRRRFNRAA